MRKLIGLLALLVVFSSIAYAQEDTVCGVYFTGVGCPHCARTDPVLLDQLTEKYSNLVLIEYEIYQQQENAYLLYEYNSKYNSGLGIPLIIFSEDKKIAGDVPILENIEGVIQSGENFCSLSDGSSISFEDLDVNFLPGKPKIWREERILIHSVGGGNSGLLKSLLISENISASLEGSSFKVINPKSVPLSGSQINFDNAIEIGGWAFQWNGEGLGDTPDGDGQSNGSGTPTDRELNWATIISLAAVDAVNPCALAVLSLMLIAIITHNPKKKRNILLSGLTFTSSVFVMYLFYGLIIIKFFQVIQALTTIRLTLYKILGAVAIVLGLLNIKDFFYYKPGGLATEMPMKLRPKVKKILAEITSLKGAFLVGAFVTVFLLPCTIGPYVIAGGILSTLELIKTIPWLLIYNFIFVLPMVAITLIVYGGITGVENVSEWKDKNIRYLHLIAGIIIIFLGVAMVLGWV